MSTLPRATRSSGPRTLFPHIFRAQEFEAAGRLFASAQNMSQNPVDPPIFENSAHQRVDSSIFQKIGIFPGFCGIFCVLANTRQTAQICCDSNTWAQKKRANGVRGPGSGLRVACRGVEAPPLLRALRLGGEYLSFGSRQLRKYSAAACPDSDPLWVGLVASRKAYFLVNRS